MLRGLMSPRTLGAVEPGTATSRRLRCTGSLTVGCRGAPRAHAGTGGPTRRAFDDQAQGRRRSGRDDVLHVCVPVAEVVHLDAMVVVRIGPPSCLSALRQSFALA